MREDYLGEFVSADYPPLLVVVGMKEPPPENRQGFGWCGLLREATE